MDNCRSCKHFCLKFTLRAAGLVDVEKGQIERNSNRSDTFLMFIPKLWNKLVLADMQEFKKSNSVRILILSPAFTFPFKPHNEKNLYSRFSTKSNTNWAVQPQKMARGLKFWTEILEGLKYLSDLRLCFRLCKNQVFS